MLTFIDADFHRVMVATASRKKNPHRAPPCEELDPPYDIMLVLCRKLHLFSGKSTKTAATRAALTSICTKSFFSWGFAPDPTGGAYSAPPALAVAYF